MTVVPFLLARSDSLLDFSIRQWRQTPAMRIEDAYKWLFHATLGGEHAVPDDEGPRQWLRREWRSLGRPLAREPQVVRLTPDGRIIRVNLRPFKARGGNPEMLLAVFVGSARRFHAERTEFLRPWHELGRRLKRGRIGYLTYPEWLRLDRSCRRAGYPAIDHSAVYERTYRPAYRVLLGSEWVQP